MREKPNIKDFRPFVMCDATNYETCKRFYSALGFTLLWDDEQSACEFATGFRDQRFLVTLHHDIDLPKGMMFQCWVEDAQAWFDYMESLNLAENFPTTALSAPVLTDWGWSITYLVDPAGIKWHFAEPQSESNRRFFNDAPWVQ